MLISTKSDKIKLTILWLGGDVLQKTSQKNTYVSRILMMILTTVLIGLIVSIMLVVGQIQGTARVVNYAGLVRGETQRIIKLENAGLPQDAMIEDVTSFIAGLRFGSDELELVRLNDADFQNKMTELSAEFDQLKEKIQLVRTLGYRQTDIIQASEDFFAVCDEATGLAAAYSQHRATTLSRLENMAVADIVALIAVIAFELFRALQFAAQNRILQTKVYKDEATGLPNKNKCEEILNREEPIPAGELVAVCVFDLNNLRTINNTMGHEKGDEYIHNFARELRAAMPEEQFVGRDGGDEFLAVLRGMDHAAVRRCLQQVRRHIQDYSVNHPEMPLSYAVGYGLSTDLESPTMRELFREADKNMYIDKNRAKMEEAEAQHRTNIAALNSIKKQGYHFSACLYCDALQDKYRALRTVTDSFLAEDGSYTGAIEQIAWELCDEKQRRALHDALQLPHLQQVLKRNTPLVLDFEHTEAETPRRGRLTVLYGDEVGGKLHHFILGVEYFRDSSEKIVNERMPLTQYYEQVKQSILESGDYVDALMQMAEAVYTVDLTHDRMESIFCREGARERINAKIEVPCSYDEYCHIRSEQVSPDTRENFRIMDSSAKMLERYRNGEKQVTIEYQETTADGGRIWLQKTMLMSQDTVYDHETGRERTIIYGTTLLKDTSAFHEKDEQENRRLEAAYREADFESKAKTEFLNRMSHDIRTPLNGIMGMLDIIRSHRDEAARVDDCLEKIRLSASHLQALVNDVLDMSKLKAKDTALEQTSFELAPLLKEAADLVDAQLVETGITHTRHKPECPHTHLIGSPVQLRQIMVNLLSNAIKYNRPGGRIDTYTKELSCDGNTVWYEFTIRDTGVGMSEEFVNTQLFHPFTQEKSDARTQYKGTGLGMSIVKELVDKMGGDIRVSSILGQGTTFVFKLPFTVDTQAEAAPVGICADPACELAGVQVLLVEDNEINMEIAEFYLTERGATVTKAWNGQEALEMVRTEPTRFAVVLMDVMMPVMDGLAATRAIRALPYPAAGVPILAMTAQTTKEAARECEAAGMNGQIDKPIEPNQMAEMILHWARPEKTASRQNNEAT